MQLASIEYDSEKKNDQSSNNSKSPISKEIIKSYL